MRTQVMRGNPDPTLGLAVSLGFILRDYLADILRDRRRAIFS